MSLQVFLQAYLTGMDEFLAAAGSQDGTQIVELLGRCAWAGLLSEVLPRALLRELRLARILLGSSGGEQFLLVLTGELIDAANRFLERAAADISRLSGGHLRLIWASTENLGAWPVVRQRLDEQVASRVGTQLADTGSEDDWFAPLASAGPQLDSSYFRALGEHLPRAQTVAWSTAEPARLEFASQGTHSWPLKEQATPDEDAIAFPRRFAVTEADDPETALAELAGRAQGTPRWGILRGDVDRFEARLRRATSIEEHIQLSVLYREFFSGELSILCALPDFFRKVSILYRGGDDFAIFGAWDALLGLARELQRLFDRFVNENLHSLAGVEGKTLSVALSVAPAIDASALSVFAAAGAELRRAKSVEIGTVHLFGRTLEWKRLADAEEVKDGLMRLVAEHGHSPQYIHDLASVYREVYSAQVTRRSKAARAAKPWRTYRRLAQVIPVSRNREWNQLRNTLITNLIGKNTANLKLRPSARVGLEWARLAAGL